MPRKVRRKELQVRLNADVSNRNIEERTLEARQRIKPYIDRYLPDDPFKTLILIVAGIMVATLFKNVCMVLNSISVDRLTCMTTLELRKEFYRRTLRMDLAGFGQNTSSELMSRFTYDLDSVSGGVQALLGRAIVEPLKMLSCLVLAAWICWRLLLVSLLVAPRSPRSSSVAFRKLPRTSQSQSDGGNVATLHDPPGDIRWKSRS